MTPTPVRIRPGGAADLHSVAALHARCTEHTLRRRFHGAHPVSDRMLRQLVEPRRGWSTLAVHGDTVVGMACVGPLSAHDAEVGVLVEDAHQGSGIGTRLVDACVREATERGFRTLLCVIEPGNAAALGVVAKVALPSTREAEDGVLGILIELQAQMLLPWPA